MATSNTSLQFSTLKSIRAFCESLHSTPDWKEVTRTILDESSDWHNTSIDFTVDGVRFIDSENIDEIQQEELASDLYCLGCFNDWFIAEITGIDVDVIEAMQKAEAFEAIGKLIISLGKLPELQAAYASADGYGHHFNGYDFSEEELRVDGRLFHVFDNRG